MLLKVLIPGALALILGWPASKAIKSCAAATPSTIGHPVKRKVLALYDGTKSSQPTFTLIHKLAEMPLNHIGYDVRYRDINSGLPTPDELSGYRGVITWFSAPLKDGNAFLNWADKAASRGLKIIVLGDLGVPVNATTHPLINRFLKHIGLRLENSFVTETNGTKVLKLDNAMVGFERPLFHVIPPYSLFSQIDPRVSAHLLVRPPPHISQASRGAVLISTGPGGGFAHSGFSSVYEAGINRDKWLINPFAFFKRALGDQTFPIPDTTTLSGRRIYFSHVDGDGWNNVSLIERYRRTQTLSAHVMLKELIEPYPDLPVTIGLVTGDLDASIGGNPGGADIARQIFKLPQVEVGSHTHTHPFNWQYFKNYDRARELKLIESQTNTHSGPPRNVFDGLAGIVKQQTPRERHAKYIADSDALPRAYMKDPFDLDQEIARSLKLAESYAPKGKRAMLMQWSGNTLPFERAIRATRRAGVRNINGGDPRFDNQWDSTSYLSPISRMVGGQRQIYAAASNENTYTNDWTGPYYAFSHLTETLNNTDLPNRLKPFNLYYHTYSAERDASLRAVRSHLDRASKGALTPVPASHYAAIADSFFKVEITTRAPDQWAISNRGNLQTLRFDNAHAIKLDWRESTGIIGTTRHGTALYIALDADVKTPLIAIKRAKDNNPQPSTTPPRPSLNDSRWRIKNLRLDTCSTSFSAQGFGNGEMFWRGIKPGSYDIRTARNAKPLWATTANVNNNGELKLKIPIIAIEPIQISFKCKARSHASRPITGPIAGPITDREQ